MPRIIPTRTIARETTAPRAAGRPMVRRPQPAPVAVKAAPAKNPKTVLSGILRSAAKLDVEIAEATQALAVLNAKRDGLRADAAAVLHDADMTTYTDNNLAYVAEIVDTFGKSSIFVDPRKLSETLKKMRKPEEFWNVVKVGIVELRKVMTEAEIERIGVKTEGEKKGSEIVIRSLTETKKKRGK